VPLFKKSFKTAFAEVNAAEEAEFQRVMALPPAADLAADLMEAFGPDGPKRGKPLTLYDLVDWMLGRYDFSSRRQRVLCSTRLRRNSSPIREALQVLEHAELVYLTIRTDSADNWRATSLGLADLASGKDAVRHRISQRSGSAPAPVTQPRQSTAARLGEVEALRAAGAISETEYAAKREQIINEI
jgi:hypothetical protein